MFLQPQSKIPELLDGLANGGYRIIDQYLVAEAGKIYTIFEAAPGEMESPMGGHRYISRPLLERGDPLLGPYLAELCDRFNRVVQSLGQTEEAAEKRSDFAGILADFERWRGV